MRLVAATLAAASFACFSTLAFAADITFQKTYSIQGAPALNVCTASGLIHVSGTSNGTSAGKVQISATVHKSNWHSMASTEEMKKIAATPPVQQNGNAIQIGDKATCDADSLHNIDIDYEISVPPDSALIAHDGTGEIHVESLKGFVRVKTGSGNIVVNGIGAQSVLITGAGNVDAGGGQGLLLVKSGSGNLTIHDSSLDGALIATGSGDIAATNLKGGIRASTGKGNISMAGLPSAAWEMRTGEGTIAFRADAGAKFELDAETGSGTIDSTLPSPLSGHITDGVLRGPVNGGGAVVKMYTGAGNITLQ